MALPIATAEDLASYLGTDSLDYTRANLILELAQNRCEAIVSPLPRAAQGVVLAIASRVFSNPEGVTAETAGPFSVTRTPGNVYLTKDEKVFLRQLSGRTGAFSIDTMPTGTSAVQLVTVSGSPTGGSFSLSFAGVKTAPLAYPPSSADMQSALSALGIIGAGNIAVTGEGPYTVTFINDLATTPVPVMTADASALTGGTDAQVVVSVVTVGVRAPGQGLPSWDRDYYSSQRNHSIGII